MFTTDIQQKQRKETLLQQDKSNICHFLCLTSQFYPKFPFCCKLITFHSSSSSSSLCMMLAFGVSSQVLLLCFASPKGETRNGPAVRRGWKG